jgi:hypothetical protein
MPTIEDYRKECQRLEELLLAEVAKNEILEEKLKKLAIHETSTPIQQPVPNIAKA